jgi:hypothetical protein
MPGLSSEPPSLLPRIVSRMRPKPTWVVVAAVALVAALAVADTVRPDGERSRASRGRPSATTTAPTRPPTLRETLARESLTGLVLYSDDRCLLHTLVLPELVREVVRSESGAALHECRFTAAVGHIVPGELEIAADGSRAARCRNGRVDLLDPAGRWTRWPFDGCPVAFQPHGAVAQSRDGEMRTPRRTLLTRRDLVHAASRHPNIASLAKPPRVRLRVADVAWFDERRVLVALEIGESRFRGERQYLAALFDGKAITGLAANLRGPYGGFVVSSNGSFAASEDGTLFARDGGSFDPPADLPRRGRAVAFSPDERWLAYVTGASIYLVATPRNDEPGRIVRLPVPAQDLTWDAVNRATRVAGLETG